jgi:hypothetical protein
LFSNKFPRSFLTFDCILKEAFSVAKRAFCDWKIRARSRVALTHVGPETLEEALQDYVNRNVDLYDLPYLTSVRIIEKIFHDK